ncbi:MarR family transcriptional regulator, partial [Streptomyces sp. NPDC001732]
MAVVNLSRALRAPASLLPHSAFRPKGRPGYGKRSVPEQRPPLEGDFAFLPERERHIAGYVDALP